MLSGEFEQRALGRLGTVLRDKYRLDDLLGVGGMAVVYKATHRNQAEFAIKMLHPELSLNADIRARFLREGYAANSVKHPGVVLVVDDDVTEEGAAFLVMELLHGIGCDRLASRWDGRLPLDAACAIGLELLDVLAAAHAKGIIHRDIKPPNLFLTHDGVLKVLDFGIARVRDSMAGGAQATGTGVVLGTPAFMSPEQAIGKASDVDVRADLWAVGATVFSLVSGGMVHEAETAPQLLVKLATQEPRSMAVVAPGTPPSIVAVIDRALAFDKARRWPTASAMQSALASAWRGVFGEVAPRAVLARTVGLAGAANHEGDSAGQKLQATRSTSSAAAPSALEAVETSEPVSRDHREASQRRSAGGAVKALATFGVLASVAGITVALRHAHSNSSPARAASAGVLAIEGPREARDGASPVATIASSEDSRPTATAPEAASSVERASAKVADNRPHADGAAQPSLRRRDVSTPRASPIPGAAAAPVPIPRPQESTHRPDGAPAAAPAGVPSTDLLDGRH